MNDPDRLMDHHVTVGGEIGCDGSISGDHIARRVLACKVADEEEPISGGRWIKPLKAVVYQAVGCVIADHAIGFYQPDVCIQRRRGTVQCLVGRWIQSVGVSSAAIPGDQAGTLIEISSVVILQIA